MHRELTGKKCKLAVFLTTPPLINAFSIHTGKKCKLAEEVAGQVGTQTGTSLSITTLHCVTNLSVV